MSFCCRPGRCRFAAGLGRFLFFCLALAAPAGAIPPLRLQGVFETGISKRVARDSFGRIYLLTLDGERRGMQTVRLRIGPESALSLADFSESPNPLLKAGDGRPVLAAGMVIDRRDRLHLVWTDKEGRSAYMTAQLGAEPGGADLIWKNPGTGRPGSLVLADTSSRIGDITLGPDGEPWVAWITIAPGHETALHLGFQRGGNWRTYRVASGYGAAPPTLMVDGRDRFHLAWHDIYDDCRILSASAAALPISSPTLPLSIPAGSGPRAQGDGGYRPVAAAAAGRLLVARENWQNRLQYLLPDEDASRLLSVTSGDARFAWDTVDSPQFAVDRYGIPWLFFIDGARQAVFYTRWLGRGWGAFGAAGKITRNTARMEDSHLPVDRVAVEERQLPGRGDIALLIENDSTTPSAVFRRIAVPTLAAEPGRKILFFDLEEIASLDGLSLALNQPRKQGQVLGPSAPGEPDADRIGPPVRVLKQNGLYRMWYAGSWKADSSDHWWEWYHAEYAESRDGRAFHRVKLGLVPFRGKNDTNLLPGLVLSHAVTGICFDPLDPVLEHRYKFLRFPNSETYSDEARAGRIDPWTDRVAGQLLESGDGIHWTPTRATIDFPAGRPLMGFIPQSFLADRGERDPGKRFKAYGFSALDKPRRSGIYAYSGDAIHWTAAPDNPVLDPLLGATPPVHGGSVRQIHDTAVWREGDYYLALYQYQHDGEFLDIRLAASRDGENFTFVHPEKPFLPAGRPGEWDSDQVNPTAPLEDDSEVKLYYGAVHYQGGAESTEARADGGLGLATLRRDGFTDLELDPGRGAGVFSTIPIGAGRAAGLSLNADCGSGWLEVEIEDPATGRPIPGYARSDCVRITGDSTSRRVEWKNHPGLGGLGRDFQVRIYFGGPAPGPKLYSLLLR